MRQVITLLILTLALAVQPVTAGLVNCDMASVVTLNSQLEECLATVAINRIDGEVRAVSAQGFLIEPGTHTVNGRVTLDTSKCHSSWDNLQLDSSPGLEINFEAGRTYYIAYDHQSPEPSEWRLIIWKVDQPCSLFQSCLPASEAYTDVPVQ